MKDVKVKRSKLTSTFFATFTTNFARKILSLQRNINRNAIMSIDTYKLTSMEEPSDEILAQLMREAAEEASRTNREATTRFFEEIKQAAAAY